MPGAVDLRVSGPGMADLARITRELKGAPKEIRKELYAALNRSTLPLKDAAREGALKHLPHHGGLADRVATATIKTRLRSGNSPSLRLEATQTGVSAERFKKARAKDRRTVRKRQKAFTAPLEG